MAWLSSYILKELQNLHWKAENVEYEAWLWNLLSILQHSEFLV